MGHYDPHASDDFPPDIGEPAPYVADPSKWRARDSAGAVVMGVGALILVAVVLMGVGR